MSSRKSRAAATQTLVANYLRDHGFPYATDAGAGRDGRDILNTIGLAFEVKARRDFSLTGSLKQAIGNADQDLPIVVVRPDGYGPVRLPEWPVVLRLADLVDLVRQAGYGDPLKEEDRAS